MNGGLICESASWPSVQQSDHLGEIFASSSKYDHFFSDRRGSLYNLNIRKKEEMKGLRAAKMNGNP